MSANTTTATTLDALQKIVHNIVPESHPQGHEKKKHKKPQKKEKKNILPPPPLPSPPQTTSEFAPHELLKEMGFDLSPTSHSDVSPTTLTAVMDEKKYDLNICLFHLTALELFQAMSNKEWYVKMPLLQGMRWFFFQNYAKCLHECSQ